MAVGCKCTARGSIGADMAVRNRGLPKKAIREGERTVRKMGKARSAIALEKAAKPPAKPAKVQK